MLKASGVFLLLIAFSHAQLLPMDEVRFDCQRADVGFLLDMSGTTKNTIYRRSIKLIQGLVREFNVQLGHSRAGLVTFSDDARTNFDFDKYPNGHEFNKALSKLPFTGGRSRIDLGLDEATIVLFNQRYNPNGNQKFLFVITDGRQTRLHSHRYPNLKERTWLLRHQRVKIIAIAMGSRPRYFFLKQLVQFPEFEMIHVSNRVNIKKRVRQIYGTACSKPPAVPTECEKMADFAFLLDQSSSIGGERNFRFETKFVKSVLDNVGNKRNQVRASVLVYGEHAKVEIKLNEFNRLEDFKAAMDERLKFKGTPKTRIDRALDLANKEVFTKKNGDRPGVPNYLVLVTDGRQNSGNWDIDQNFVQWYAKPIWKRNITIFAIGVASARFSQLRQIAGPSGTAIYRRRINMLSSAVDAVIPSNCRGCHKKVNLGFVVDASGTSRRHYEKMKRLIHHTIEGFKPQKNRSIASVIRFGTKPVVDIHFGQFREIFSFQAEVDTKMPFMGGYSYIDLALRSAEAEFKANADHKLPKVLIVITDGRQTGRRVKSVLRAAEELRKHGVRTVAVAFGNCRRAKCKRVIGAIAGDPRYIIKFHYKDNILEISEKIAKVSCPTDVTA